MADLPTASHYGEPRPEVLLPKAPARPPRCTGASWVRTGRGQGHYHRCSRRTWNADRRCWQHHDQPTITNLELAHQ